MEHFSIPAGSKRREPVHLRCSDGDYHTIDVEAGATVTIVEEWNPDLGKEHACSVELHLAPRACVSYIACHAYGDRSSTLRHTATIGDHASLHWHLATFGGMQIEHTLRSVAAGDGAESSIDWIFFASGREKQTLSVQNIFQGRDGRGEVTMKGVAQERAHASAKGIIEIGEQGNGTDTYLTQSVLMLDATAKVDAVPALEIKTNDVKASHSASVARVSPEDLFYFASRGIEKNEARRMYIEGFLGEIAQRIPEEAVREEVMRSIRGL